MEEEKDTGSTRSIDKGDGTDNDRTETVELAACCDVDMPGLKKIRRAAITLMIILAIGIVVYGLLNRRINLKPGNRFEETNETGTYKH